METIEVLVSRYVKGRGYEQGDTRPVRFEAHELARHDEGDDREGVTQTLYVTPDERLIVHVKEWSRPRHGPDTYRLHEVSDEDLNPGGRFEDLGGEWRQDSPLTLEEALAQAPDYSE